MTLTQTLICTAYTVICAWIVYGILQDAMDNKSYVIPTADAETQTDLDVIRKPSIEAAEIAEVTQETQNPQEVLEPKEQEFNETFESLMDANVDTVKTVQFDTMENRQDVNQPKEPKEPVRPLIVLDLNGTLIHRQFRHMSKNHPKYKSRLQGIPDFKVGQFDCWKRPHLDEFIDHLFAKNQVAVWTSAMRKNSQGIIDAIFGQRQSELLFVWSREECSNVMNTCNDHSSTKDIRRIPQHFPIPLENIWFIEDGSEKHVKEYVDRVVLVPKWSGNTDDTELLWILDRLGLDGS